MYVFIIYAIFCFFVMIIIGIVIYIVSSHGVCVCANCVSSRLNTTDPFGYKPCVNSIPEIKLAHHKATIKTKNHIADIKKGEHEQ